MMWTVDRFEDDFAVICNENGERLNVPASLLCGLSEGDIFSLKKEEAAKEAKEEVIKDKLKKLFGE